jgi:hypothetical protein
MYTSIYVHIYEYNAIHKQLELTQPLPTLLRILPKTKNKELSSPILSQIGSLPLIPAYVLSTLSSSKIFFLNISQDSTTTHPPMCLRLHSRYRSVKSNCLPLKQLITCEKSQLRLTQLRK